MWGCYGGDSLGWYGAIGGGVVFDCPGTDAGAERFEDRHGLADQARHGLVVPLRTVENGDIGSGQTLAGAPNHFWEHGDELLVEGYPVVRSGGFGPYPGGLSCGDDLGPLGLGLGRADHLGQELLLAKLGVAFGHLGLFGEDLLLGPGAANGPD